MRDKLQALFQSAFTADYHPQDFSYYWFLEDSHYFGIKKSSLSEEQYLLLKQLFHPVSNPVDTRNQTAIQKQWYQFLVERELELPATTQSSVRFYFFQFEQSLEDYWLFEEAVRGFFEQPVLVWLSEQKFVVIERQVTMQGAAEHAYLIIDTLSSDFLISIHSFTGQLHRADALLNSKFTAEWQLFQTLDLSEGAIHQSFYKVFPVALIKQQISTQYYSNLLLEQLEDLEVLQTIQTFLSHTQNSSSTAKALYIHRNSLQYRLDKFTEKTGIDLRTYENALFLSLAILHLQHAQIR